MALEQEQRVTFIEGSENIILESEEVKITPPARRKKAEKKKKIKAGRNLPLPGSDERTINDGCSNTVPAELSQKIQDEKDYTEPSNNGSFPSQGVAMNTESHETKNGVLKDSCTDHGNANEDTSGSCFENSFVEANDLAAYANDTNSVLSSSESEPVQGSFNFASESKEELGSVVGFESSQGSCISPESFTGPDEESFFSAEETEISQELSKVTEVVNETATDLENIEGHSSVNSENTHTKEETAIRQEISQAPFSADPSDQRLEVEDLEESLENHPGLHDSAKETLNTETSFIESSNNDDHVSETVRIDSSDSDLSVDTATDLGAVGGPLESDSADSDEEWSSSSYTSSEGEYDVGLAEVVRGIQEEQDFEQDNLNDGVEEILSAFSHYPQIVSVTTDSEDDSNKGDSLNNTFKTADEPSTENDLSPLNIMGDNDEVDAGKQILSFFPPSECPVIVDITANDADYTAGNRVTESAKVEDQSCNDERTSAEVPSTADEVNSNQVKNESVTDTVNSDHTTTGSLTESPDLESNDDQESFPVKRTGSFRLINNNGVLKVIDSGETPVTTENVKEAKLLKTKSLKGASTDGDVDKSNSDSAEARKQLGNTMSEAKTLDKEFQNVCKNIATLERMSEDDVERSNKSENKGSKDDLVESSQDSSAVIITVDSMTSAEQKPEITLEGVTMGESATDDQDDNGSVREGEINGRTDETDSSSSSNTKKQRPKRLVNTKRYSLDTESALLSPEDDVLVELTNFGSNNSIKSDESASPSESQTDIVKMSTDGQQFEEATPCPPPRPLSGRHKNLTYSGSFNSAAAARQQPVDRKEGSRRFPKRARSERSKTLPNNAFDVASDKLSRLFTSSSSSEPMHQGPITLITDNMPATFTGFPINRRAQVALELYTTERSYVRGLETILQLFKKPCEENKLLDKKEAQTIFGNIQDIYVVNKDVLFMLLERISHWHDQQCLGDIFADQSFKIIDRMKIYAKYCNNYDSADTLYKQKIKKKEFESFLNSCYEHQVCQPGLNLPAYLITVVQRIPRYLLLLEDFFKRTPENHPDHGNLSKALTKMSNLAVYINNQLQTVVGQKAMVELRSRVIGLKAFEVPGRALIKEADVLLPGSKKTRKCLLFNDMLVFAAKGVTKTSEVEQTLELATLWCMDLEGNNPQSAKEDSLEIYTPEHSYIVDAGTKTEKKAWLQKLRTRIAMALHGAEATEKNEIESRKANFTYKDGRIFCGNFVSGKRHGEGTLSWPNQARYQGCWEDDDRNGWGELTYNSGDKYRGEWLDDKQHGVGIMEYTNGDVYNGQWDEGDIHGQGGINFKNGDRFTGEFFHNEIQGIGELRCVSGLSYKGEWSHSKKHGRGKMQFPNGDVYSGQFANDRISGQGDMHYADGSAYKGQWVDNQRGGFGEFSSSDGTHYVGGWSGDHITGKGRMTYSNGDCYDGNWFKNTRFGQGIMKYSNGDIYEGVSEYDLRSKCGKMTYKDGSEYEGSWENGLRHGKGKMTYSDKKSMFEGEWMLGLRHGQGVLTCASGASYRGHWEFDKQTGRGMYTDPSASYHYEGEWKKGLKHGKGVEQTTEGTYEGEWKDNMRHGQGREILSCETEFEGRWKENRKHGPGIKKLKTGRMEEQVWREGKHVDVSSVVVIELPLIQRR